MLQRRFGSLNYVLRLRPRCVTASGRARTPTAPLPHSHPSTFYAPAFPYSHTSIFPYFHIPIFPRPIPSSHFSTSAPIYIGAWKCGNTIFHLKKCQFSSWKFRKIEAMDGIFYFSTPFSVPFCFPAGKLGKLRLGVVFFKFPPRNQPHTGQKKLFLGNLESCSIFRPNFLGVFPYAFKCLVATCVSKHLSCTIPRLRKRQPAATRSGTSHEPR